MWGPFLGSEAVAGGLVSRDQLRGPRFRRVFPDVYLPSSVELDLVTRSMAAYLLVRDRGGVLGGYSADALLDAGCGPYRAPARLDRQRDAELAGCGWQTLRLVHDDLAAMPQTVHRVRRLLELRADAELYVSGV